MSFFQNLDWENWLYGLWVAVVGGASNSVTAGLALNFIDPKDFNAQQSKLWQVVGALFIVTAVKDFFLYLSQNPAPKLKTTTSITATGSSVTMKQTVEPAPGELKGDSK